MHAHSAYDDYTCSECKKHFPGNSVMYGCLEENYDICGRCIINKYPAPGTLAVQKAVLASTQVIVSPGSSLDMAREPTKGQKAKPMTPEMWSKVSQPGDEARAAQPRVEGAAGACSSLSILSRSRQRIFPT